MQGRRLSGTAVGGSALPCSWILRIFAAMHDGTQQGASVHFESVDCLGLIAIHLKDVLNLADSDTRVVEFGATSD